MQYLKDEVVTQRYMGIKAILTLRQTFQSHLAKMDRDIGYEDRLAELATRDDRPFFRRVIERSLQHFTLPVSNHCPKIYGL
jgi:hypothetical protein